MTKQRGFTAAPSLSPTNPSAAKFASQGNAHVRTDTQIKFLYYPCVLTYILENDV